MAVNTFRAYIFGRFGVLCGDRRIDLYDCLKAQQLFAYLLLNKDRSVSREKLASLLWQNCSTAHSKAYLRKALWQLHGAVSSSGARAEDLIGAESDWLQINRDATLWVDAAAFQEAYASVRGVCGRDFDSAVAKRVVSAIDLYVGDLLESWYDEWCLVQRERMQHIYLIMLEKIIDYFESQGRFESGMTYGERILLVDRARENAHRRMMRLYYLAGDRTGALRQFDRCRCAMKEELEAAPSKSTHELHEQIKNGGQLKPEVSLPDLNDTDMLNHIDRIRQLQKAVIALQQQIDSELNFLCRPSDRQPK